MPTSERTRRPRQEPAETARELAVLRSRLAEAERASAEKAGRLAAASHDLQQPLRSLRYLLAALGGEPQSARASETIATMAQCLDALEARLEGLLEVSRLEAGGVAPRFAPVPLGPLFEQLEREFAPQAAERGSRLKRVPTTRVVQSDPALLPTVLRNLLSNAIKYTPEGRILLGCRGRGGHARIAVIDTGMGIAAQRQAEIFAPFHQLDEAAQGQGLGLAIVARIASLLDHPVGLHSEPEHGSTFWIDVPELAEGSPRDD